MPASAAPLTPNSEPSPVPAPRHRKRHRGRTFRLRALVCGSGDRSVLPRLVDRLRRSLLLQAPQEPLEPGTGTSFWQIESTRAADLTVELPASILDIDIDVTHPNNTQKKSVCSEEKIDSEPSEVEKHRGFEEDTKKIEDQEDLKPKNEEESSKSVIKVEKTDLMKVLKQSRLVHREGLKTSGSSPRLRKRNPNLKPISSKSSSKVTRPSRDPSVASKSKSKSEPKFAARDIRSYFDNRRGGGEENTYLMRGKVTREEGGI